jgi:glycerophosphoryl diester phosphodiesterase
MVVAHRGASLARPENTVAAFVEARRLGADGVELDVRLSVDHELIVHHDPQLGDGRAIRELTRADRPDSVPTLAEALDACAGMGVNVEVKHDRGDRDRPVARATAAELVARAEANGGARSASGRDEGDWFSRLLVSSFDRQSIDLVRELAPRLATAALGFRVYRVDRWVAQVAAAGHAAINPWDRLTDATLVTRAHREGLKVYPWTVDDPDRIRQLADLGVDGIITNVPDVARAVLASR